jgi:hypothetical protein
MATQDLTLLFLTANEVPVRWASFHWETLKKATDAPVLISSRKPMEGMTVLDTEPKSYMNIYKQMLVLAKRATTDFVAMVEDDTLYSKEHFLFRPKLDEFAYNRSRWSLFTWDGTYSLRRRVSNCSLIAPRLLLIEALEERFSKPRPDNLWGELGRSTLERGMGVTERKLTEFWSEVPVIQLNHDAGTDHLQGRRHKKHGEIKAVEIPHWGKGKDICANYR